MFHPFVQSYDPSKQMVAPCGRLVVNATRGGGGRRRTKEERIRVRHYDDDGHVALVPRRQRILPIVMFHLLLLPGSSRAGNSPVSLTTSTLVIPEPTSTTRTRTTNTPVAMITTRNFQVVPLSSPLCSVERSSSQRRRMNMNGRHQSVHVQRLTQRLAPALPTGTRLCAVPRALASVVTLSSSPSWWSPTFLGTASCFVTWLAVALLGYVMEQRILRDSAILVTLTLSALLCQPSPILSDLCWTTFLPASLAFLLLSLDSTGNNKATPPDVSPRRRNSSTFSDGDNRDSISQSIKRLMVPFCFASLGSVLGCVLVFVLCCYCCSTTGGAAVVTGPWLLAPNEARIALSCLTASFIGGSVNFFSTAHIILREVASSSSSLSSATTSSVGTMTNVISSMATADVVVMAVYFAVLSSAVSSMKLRNWFDASASPQNSSNKTSGQANLVMMSNNNESNSEEKERGGESDTATVSGTETTTRQLPVSKTTSAEQSWVGQAQGTIVASSMALAIVRFATSVEHGLSSILPGLACGVVATLTPWIQQQLNNISHSSCWSKNNKNKAPFLILPLCWRQWYQARYGVVVSQASRPLSQLSFLLMFVCLGSESSATLFMNGCLTDNNNVNNDTGSWLQSGPACCIVSMLVLAVHGSVTLLGSWLWAARCRRGGDRNNHKSHNNNRISLEDVLVASNAAIGGPATAAAFCGRLCLPHSRGNTNKIEDEEDNHRDLKGLTFAATFWGIVGYALGTTVGVLTYRLLGVIGDR